MIIQALRYEYSWDKLFEKKYKVPEDCFGTRFLAFFNDEVLFRSMGGNGFDGNNRIFLYQILCPMAS